MLVYCFVHDVYIKARVCVMSLLFVFVMLAKVFYFVYQQHLSDEEFIQFFSNVSRKIIPYN